MNLGACCDLAVWDSTAGWWCADHDEGYADLQAEHLAAADLDPYWPAVYE